MALLTIVDSTHMLPGFLDSSNPRSLVSIAPLQIQTYIASLDPSLLTLSDKVLNKQAEPELTDKCLRINFWTEYVRAQDKSTTMLLGNIIRGVTTKEYFLHIAENNPAKLAYIIIPPKDYNIVQDSIFRDSLEKLRQLISLPPYDIVKRTTISDKGETVTETKRLNPAYIAEVRKVTTMLADRLQGSISRKVDISGKLKVEREQESQLAEYTDLRELEEALGAEEL